MSIPGRAIFAGLARSSQLSAHFHRTYGFRNLT
jgi:hypothetical protein